MLVISFRAVWA